jgi:hypothetical protein
MNESGSTLDRKSLLLGISQQEEEKEEKEQHLLSVPTVGDS